MSIRAYTNDSIMIAAEVIEGSRLRDFIEILFTNPNISYLCVHNAKPGCFNCCVQRYE
ncbi:MAG: DUF1203 domain-containing protein [Gammaproteobacteria bacterium]|nr:DUF1203 domain-containing protein [Gammaproteobacteria bacterium]MCW5584353.1 DUF1203 domain-containing protein [Gammaproteobacteria bacterium]